MTDMNNVTLIKLLFMEVNLVHHGLNLERRKMYPSNRNYSSIQLEITLSVPLI